MGIEQAAMQSRYVAENAVHVECLGILTRPRTQFSLEQRQQEAVVKRSILAVLLQCSVNLDVISRNVGATLAVALEGHRLHGRFEKRCPGWRTGRWPVRF